MRSLVFEPPKPGGLNCANADNPGAITNAAVTAASSVPRERMPMTFLPQSATAPCRLLDCTRGLQTRPRWVSKRYYPDFQKGPLGIKGASTICSNDEGGRPPCPDMHTRVACMTSREQTMKRSFLGVAAITAAVVVPLLAAGDASARKNRDQFSSDMPRVTICSSQPTKRLCVSCCTALKVDGARQWNDGQCQDHCRLPRMGTLVDSNKDNFPN